MTEPLKGLGRESILFPGGGTQTTTASRTGSGAPTATPEVTSGDANPPGSGPGRTNSFVTTTRNAAGASGSQGDQVPASTTPYVPPAWQCPNAPGCPIPTTSSGGPLTCSTGSNIGLATFNPATWCGCNDNKVYPTRSGATLNYCAYTVVPEETIRPSQTPDPFPHKTINMRNGEVTACATSSVDTSKSSTACAGSSTIISTVTSIAAAAVPTADCDFWDQVLYWQFEVYKINGWAGDGGSALRKEEKWCGGLTGWQWHVDNDRYQHAYFNLPFTIKSGCVERAIASAGGPEGLSCTGHGLKKRSAVGEDSPLHKNLKSRLYGKISEHRFSHEVFNENAINASNPNISRRVIVPRAHTDAWNRCAPKGIQYYNEWKNRGADQDDKPALCNFDQTYDFSQDPLSVTGPYDPIKAYIDGEGGQTYTNFRWHWPKGPTNQATAIFWNNISPADKTIIAFFNDRGGDEEEGEDKSPDNWSDMLW